jgi:alkylation response protein AidB-like acyl-CoA dehydrogenase
MPTYTAPTRQTAFVLNEVLKLADFDHLPGYDVLDREALELTIETLGRFASEVVTPLNGPGDEQGCRMMPDGSVVTPDGYAEAYRRFHADGWGAMTLPESVGGAGAPGLLNVVVLEYLSSASQAFQMHAIGPTGTLEVLSMVASEEQLAVYGPKLLSGEWSGNMALTEPHAGSDVGLLTTQATPNGDGSYAVTGTKIFITNGEHDLTENIVHLVLARTPGAPAGTRGISMFLVPKVLVNADGSLGEANSLHCGSIEHKMGLRASPTCTMNYDGATGWLVGDEHAGLAAMFILMNAKRLEVGIQGLAAAEVAYQNAAAYATERRQGRALAGPVDPDQVADPILVHPDVRRMLMDTKAFIEPMRALTLWCGLLGDLAHRSDDQDERRRAAALMAFLIPIVKGYGTERALQCTIDMQQIFGGHGYVTETGMDQFVRDVRVTTLYEGTTGIQAMDMVKRKLDSTTGVDTLNDSTDGTVVAMVCSMIAEECEAAGAHPSLDRLARSMSTALEHFTHAAKALRDREIADRAAVSYAFLELTGVVTLGLMWLRMAGASARAVAAGSDDDGFHQNKIATANYFADAYLARCQALRAQVEDGNGHLMTLAADAFGPNR